MPTLDPHSPIRGAYIALEQLIAQRFPARQLRLAQRRRAKHVVAGPSRSHFRGRGLDFEEVRAYHNGDDIRTIDWRVTARTGLAHTKVFREERERPVLIVVDQRNSMFFGSTHCFKSALAAHLASLLAWSALQNGDRVGGLVFNDDGHTDVRPKRSRKSVLGLLSEIVQYNKALPRASQPLTHSAAAASSKKIAKGSEDQDADNSFVRMLENLRRIAHPGTRVFIISDFRGAACEPAKEQLFQLAKHTEVVALRCTDLLELELPKPGSYVVTDGTHRSQLQTGDKAARQQYHDRFHGQRAATQDHLQRLGVPVLDTLTSQAPFTVIAQFFSGRYA